MGGVAVLDWEWLGSFSFLFCFFFTVDRRLNKADNVVTLSNYLRVLRYIENVFEQWQKVTDFFSLYHRISFVIALQYTISYSHQKAISEWKSSENSTVLIIEIVCRIRKIFLMIKPLLFVVIRGKPIVTHPYVVNKVRIHDLRNMTCMICKRFSNFKREIIF